MKNALLFSAVLMALAIPTTGHASRGAEIVRTVYFSASDAKGVMVTDLTASDLRL